MVGIRCSRNGTVTGPKNTYQQKVDNACAKKAFGWIPLDQGDPFLSCKLTKIEVFSGSCNRFQTAESDPDRE